MSAVPPPLPALEAVDRLAIDENRQAALIARLQRDVLPALFAQEVDIGRYGPSTMTHQITEPSRNDGGATELAQLLGLMMQRLQEDSLDALSARASWWRKATGLDIEGRVNSEIRFGTIADIAMQIETQSGLVRNGVLQLDTLRDQQAQQIFELQAYIAAGKAFAAELPAETVLPELDSSPRNRLLRRLTNLAVLLASLEMGQLQLQLARGNALSLLDRCGEVIQVLLPMWQQSRRALFSSRNTDPVLIGAARQAQQNLLLSLQQILTEPTPLFPTPSTQA